MSVCPYVRDRCCTFSDEIRMTKLFKDRTLTLMNQHADQTVQTITMILRLFDKVRLLDPMLFNIRFKRTVKLEYEQEICNKQLKIEKATDKHEFIKYYDTALINAFQEKSLTPLTPDKIEKIISYEKDTNGDRHWGVPYKYKDLNFLKRHAKSVEALQNDDISFTQVQCNKKKTHFYKDFIMINEFKSELCFKLYEKSLYFNNEQLIEYMSYLKANISSVQNLRSGYYCALCDAQEQKFFDIRKKEIVMSEGFCKDLVTTAKDYLKFMHIIILEYMDFMMEMVNCYEGDPKYYVKNKTLTIYRQRLSLLRQCFTAIDNNDNVMRNCWFICQAYSFRKISNFFDGELEMLRKIELQLISFMRKMYKTLEAEKKYPKSKKVISNMNGFLLEPVNPSYAVSGKYYFGKNERKELLGTLNTMPHLSKKLISSLKSQFKHRGYNEALKTLNKWEGTFKDDNKQKLELKKNIYKLGLRRYDKINAKIRPFIRRIDVANRYNLGFRPERKLNIIQANNYLKKIKSTCNVKKLTEEYGQCVKKQVPSQLKMLSFCDTYKSNETEFKDCQNVIRASPEYGCWNLSGKKNEYQNCFFLQDHKPENLCSQHSQDSKIFKTCMSNLSDKATYNCRQLYDIKDMKKFNDCIYVTNNNSLNSLNDKFKAQCDNKIKNVDTNKKEAEYQLCISKTLHVHPFYKCREKIRKYLEFEECVEELRNEAKGIKKKRVKRHFGNKSHLNIKQKVTDQQLIDKAKREEELKKNQPKVIVIDDTKKALKLKALKKKNLHYPVSRVEEGLEIYEKQKKIIDINKFKEVFKINGMNPFKFFEMIKLDKTVEEIVNEKSMGTQDINIGILNKFLSVKHSDVNNFNHIIDDHIETVPEQVKKLQKMKAKYNKENNIFKRIKMKNELTDIQKEAISHVKAKEDIKHLKKLKTKIKQNKIQEQRTQKTVIENHVSKKNFDQNFHGIGNLFTSLFGTQQIFRNLFYFFNFLNILILIFYSNFISKIEQSFPQYYYLQ